MDRILDANSIAWNCEQEYKISVSSVCKCRFHARTHACTHPPHTTYTKAQVTHHTRSPDTGPKRFRNLGCCYYENVAIRSKNKVTPNVLHRSEWIVFHRSNGAEYVYSINNRLFKRHTYRTHNNEHQTEQAIDN